MTKYILEHTRNTTKKSIKLIMTFTPFQLLFFQRLILKLKKTFNIAIFPERWGIPKLVVNFSGNNKDYNIKIRLRT